MVARSNDKAAARARARERRLALDADRRKRDERVDEAVADFEIAADALRDAHAAVAAAEVGMGRAAAAVLAEGETVERAAALCQSTSAEVRRLVKLTRPGDDSTPTKAAAGGSSAA